MMNDPVADMLTRVRNATMVGSEKTVMPASRFKESIARILAAEGYIDGFEVEGEGPKRELRIRLRYGRKRLSAIQGIRRVSKPGHRIYAAAGELPRVQGGLGVVIVSTSQGLLPDREARRRRLGGEVICEVW
ncbi:MAG TPA: 30S ribosomal protein S8 [Acidimicrobiia bacterium]|nr:30S ribosomal protein S8 [Acidimicrobiia bacterium]